MYAERTGVLLTFITSCIARKHFKFELLTSELPKRWTGPGNNIRINESCKYIGFVLPMAKDPKARIVLIYPIIRYFSDPTKHRPEWSAKSDPDETENKIDFSNRQTVFFGDLLAIVPWDEFIKKNEGNKVDCISGTNIRYLKSDWLDKLIDEKQNLDELISLVDIPISTEEAKGSFAYADRYELIVKASLDAQFPGIFKHNETIQVENKSYRPDFYAETKKYMLVLEYDENNHQAYDLEQEIIRINHIRDYMLEEYQLPTVIIRYGNKFQRWSDADLFMNTVKKYYTNGNKIPLLRSNAKKNIEVYPNTIVLVGYPFGAYQGLPDWQLCNLNAQGAVSV